MGGVFITFTDTLGTGTTLTKAKGKSYYDLSMNLGDVTYKALPDESDSNLYYFYYDASSKSGKLSSTVTVDDATNSLTWKVNAEELPIVKFANRTDPGTELDGVVYVSAAPIELKYDVELTSEGTDTIYSKEKDKTANNKVYSNAFDSTANASVGSTTATFTPKPENSYYYDGDSKKTETAIDKASDGNPTSSATTTSSYAWAEGDYVASLGNNARAQGIAKVDITSDKSSYKQGDEIVYTVKATNLSDSKISNTLIRVYLPECATYTTSSESGIKLSSDGTYRYLYVSLDSGKTKTFTIDATINDQDSSDCAAKATIARVNSKTITLVHPALDKADIDVEYELKYKLNGGSFTGSVDNPQTYKVDDSLTLETPTLEGCTFAGWKVEATSGSWTADEVYDPNEPSIGDGNYGNVTLIAQWEATYSYTAKDHGEVQVGTESDTSYEETIDAVSGTASTVTAVPDPGYYFDGWYSDSSCTTKVSDSASYTPTKADTNETDIKAYKNGTFFAKFSPVLSIEKTASTESPTVLPGNKITYTIKVKNNTDKALSEIYVKDVIPAGLGSLNFSFNATGKAYTVSCDNLFDKTNEKVFKISEIEAGKSAEFEFSVLISEDSTAKSFTNTAKVTSFKYDGSKIEEFNPEASATTNVSDYVKVVYHFVDKPESVDDSTGKDSLLPATDFVAIDTAYTSKKKGRDNKRDIACKGYSFEYWYTDKACTTKYSDGTVVTSSNTTSGVLDLYGKWIKDVYVIEYVLDGGEFKKDGAVIANPNPATYSIDTSTFTLTNPTKTGYTFAGWTGTGLSEASTEVSVVTGSTGDRKYTATWTNSTNTKYDVKHYQQNIKDDNYTLFETENKTGTTAADTEAKAKTYEGFTAGSVTQKKIEPDGSTVVEIYYTRNSYEVSYEFKNTPTGASNCPTGGSYKYGQTVPLAADATAPNYKFGGWTQKKATESEKTLVIETAEDKTKSFKMPANNIVLEGEFKPIEYTIEYVLNGGSVEGSNPVKYTVESDAITLINPTRKGYTFDGWTGGVKDKAAEVTNDKSVKIAKGSTGNRKYTANWTPIEYKITYNLDDGIFRDASGDKIDNPNVKTYTAETSSFTLSNPTKKGYTFAGWTGTDLDKATLTVTIPIGSTGDREYTATWVKNNNAVTFDTNGHGGSVPGISELDYGEKVSRPEDPKENGYVFGGWYKEPSCKNAWDFENDTMPDGALVLYAKWTPYEYSITYDLDGGSVDGTNPTRYSIESADIVLINPTREGYSFLGWTGTELSAASTSVIIAHGSTGNREYKANWKADDIDLKYDGPSAGPYDAKNPEFTTPQEDKIPLNDGIIVDPNSGEWKHGDSTYTEATEITLTGNTSIDKPTREGYIFMGWEKSIEGGKIKLTAIWAADGIGAEEGKPGNSDNIPDIYQKRIIFKVKNGVWKDGTKKDIVLVVNLVNENGELDSNGTAEIEIPKGMKPNKGYKKDGSWDTEPLAIVSGPGELVYTFTFESKQSTNPAGDNSDDSTASDSTASDSTKTGDATDIESVVLYAGGGILALLMAAWLLRRKLR